MLEALLEGARKAGCGVSEALGEARAGLLVEDAGEMVGVAGESCVDAYARWWRVGMPVGGVAHRGRLLEGDSDAAARGVLDSLLGLAVEVVVLQAVTGW